MRASRLSSLLFGHRPLALLLLAALLASGCSTLPPGAYYPRTTSTAFSHPDTTRFGQQFERAALGHPGESGFRIVPVGADGFLLRMQLINAAQRTLDLQYFIFRGDQTGRLLTDAILRAADRGVRVRILLDDGETVDGDDQITALEAHPEIQIRYYNPFRYRGSVQLFRAVEFAFNASRLDYRMHNKLFVVDNAVALVGGRNIGDEYFQIKPDGQYADDDMFTVGPTAQQLSVSFDTFWNNPLSIPEAALAGAPTRHDLKEHRVELREHRETLKDDGVGYVQRIASGEPFNGIMSGRLPLVWAHAQLVYDSPNKKDVENGDMVGKLMHRPVAKAAAAVQHELLMITPYLIPGDAGMKLFTNLRQRGVTVRILTTSLEASNVIVAQSGYMHYRMPLLQHGVELHEIRAQLGNTHGSGQTRSISRAGNYSLHAKMFVFDRQSIFIGSMNFDQRSMHLNTEIGLIIDSPELAAQVAARFAAMTQPANAYQLLLEGEPPHLSWHTQEDGLAVEYTLEPARSAWQRLQANALSLLPLDDEL